MFRDMHIMEPHADDIGVFLRSTCLVPSNDGSNFMRKVLLQPDVEGHAPEVPRVTQVRIEPIPAARFGPHQASWLEAEDACLARFDIPWATFQSVREDIRHGVKITRMEDYVEPLCHRISCRSHSSTQVPVQWNGNLESRVIPFTKIMTATVQIAPRVSLEEEWLDQLLDQRSLIKPSGELCHPIVGCVLLEPLKVFQNCGSGEVNRLKIDSSVELAVRPHPAASFLLVHTRRHNKCQRLLAPQRHLLQVQAMARPHIPTLHWTVIEDQMR